MSEITHRAAATVGSFIDRQCETRANFSEGEHMGLDAEIRIGIAVAAMRIMAEYVSPEARHHFLEEVGRIENVMQRGRGRREQEQRLKESHCE